ncbi:MAG: hypothetical protein ISS82_04650 [Nanoarchaeota archaeon]|nr:hypothetical protein [Nanoarchaeota archaeon]
MARKEWWQRSMELYFGRKKRDPVKLAEEIQKGAAKYQEETNEFQRKFKKGVEEYKRRLKKVIKR